MSQPRRHCRLGRNVADRAEGPSEGMHTDTIGARFLNAAERFADRPAIIEGNDVLPFGGYAGAALAVAAAIEASGTGEHVAIMLPTSRAFALSFLGAGLSGRVPVPLNFFLAPAELKAILADCGARTLITARAFGAIAEQLGVETVYAEEFIPRALSGKPAQPKEHGTAAILYTSGTTGRPKGVVLSHRNILANVDGCVVHFAFSHEHTILAVLPYFHTFALTTTFAIPATIGAAAVVVAKFDPGAVLGAIERHRVTTMMAVPSMYRALARSIERGGDMSSVGIPITGGEPLAQELFDLYREKTGVTLLEGYGMTEASPAVSANTPTSVKPLTVGRPLCNVEVRVVREDGQDAGINVDGEIWVRGDNVMEGYHNLPEETKAVITGNAFLRTGDIGRFDSDGFLRITGRLKEMIISAGENIFPREVELAVAAHPAVEEAAVMGIPDRVHGEAPKAFVVLKAGATATADEIRSFCRERIAAYKVPTEIEFRESLPHGPTGKVLKQRLVCQAPRGRRTA